MDLTAWRVGRQEARSAVKDQIDGAAHSTAADAATAVSPSSNQSKLPWAEQDAVRTGAESGALTGQQTGSNGVDAAKPRGGGGGDEADPGSSDSGSAPSSSAGMCVTVKTTCAHRCCTLYASLTSARFQTEIMAAPL